MRRREVAGVRETRQFMQRLGVEHGEAETFRSGWL
jgi:hypothetical protein